MTKGYKNINDVKTMPLRFIGVVNNRYNLPSAKKGDVVFYPNVSVSMVCIKDTEAGKRENWIILI